jgi:predicted ATP-dependent endonuclease of OLD family
VPEEDIIAEEIGEIIMANIIEISIKNFRGIKNFEHKIPIDRGFICLVGRGDSGKTTILDAISRVLSSKWNLTFYDTDFYNCDCNQNIEIEVTLINLPDELLSESRYGLWQKGYDPRTHIILDEMSNGNLSALSIRLIVGKNLEPKWEVVNNRQQENKPISATDRDKLNCFMVSDYVDSHFSWNKGNPLYSLLRINDGAFGEEDRNVVLDAIREAKATIDDYNNEILSQITKDVINQVSSLGLDISDSKASIDFRDISFREGRVCLHDDQKIPFRLKGKGSKRLISIAIQMSLAKHGGIILIDEIEQGLEPDRIKLLARTLRHNDKGQVFITTHSRDVITEISSGDIIVIHSDRKNGLVISKSLSYDNDRLKGTVRACPEAFFASKIIVCEGATEIGICRALDRYRQDNGQMLMSFEDCTYVDGTGSNLVSYTEELEDAGFKVALFCDSEDTRVNGHKEALIKKGIDVFDCEPDNSIDQQVFYNLPWEAVKNLINYVKEAYGKDEDAIADSVKSKYEGSFPENWLDSNTEAMRKAIGITAKRNDWFKRIDHGEVLGNIIFKYFDEMDEHNHLKKIFVGLSTWVDE